MSDKNSDDCIKVLVRCRPLSKKETKEGSQKIIQMDPTMGTVTIRKPTSDSSQPITHNYTFDNVYDDNSAQTEIFDEAILPLIENALEGFNVTIFAYGQTGSGKTYTMSGTPESPGILPQAFQYIFDRISQSTANAAKDKREGVEFLVRASFLEIYCEVIRDLLYDKRNPECASQSSAKIDPMNLKLKLNQNGNLIVHGLTEFRVDNTDKINHLLDIGNRNRTVAATSMNDESSRSHSIFTITVECSEVIDGKTVIRMGKINLVDLAGSEKQKKTNTSGVELKEGSQINLSLTILGMVINSLVEKKKHIPYRDSVLTRLLEDSLGGNAKTLMIVAISPASSNFDETMGTLRYANRAKQIKNKPKINEDPKDAQLRQMRDQIKLLEERIAATVAQANILEKEVTKVKKTKIKVKSRHDGDKDGREYTAENEEANDENQQTDAQEEGEDGGSQEYYYYYSDNEADGAQSNEEDGVDAEGEDNGLNKRKDDQKSSKKHSANATKHRKKRRKLQEALENINRLVKAKEEKAEKARAAVEKMTQKLQEVKKMVLDSSNLEKNFQDHEMELRKARQEYSKRLMREREMKRQAAEIENAKVLKRTKFTSLKDKIETLSKTKQQLSQENLELMDELDNLANSHKKELEILMIERENTVRMLGLQDYLLRQFVPDYILERLEDSLEWSDLTGGFIIKNGEFSGNAIRKNFYGERNQFIMMHCNNSNGKNMAMRTDQDQ